MTSRLDQAWNRIPKTLAELKRDSFDEQSHVQFRSVRWRLLLRIMPIDEKHRAAALKESRSLYSDLKAKFLQPPQKEDADPLNESEDNPWNKWFELEELRSHIEQDAERTMPQLDMFRSAKMQKTMTNILLVFSKMNPAIEYRQGMHDVLGLVLYTVRSDMLSVDETLTNPLARMVLDPTYLEHDAFTLFSTIMRSLMTYYDPSPSEQLPNRKLVPPIVALSHNITGPLLKMIDPDVHRRLSEFDVEPQIFLLRWIRLLFLNEFPVDACLAIWDGIFADGDSLQVVPYVCIAMILRLKPLLLTADETTALYSLLHYPEECQDAPHIIVRQASELRQHPAEFSGSQCIQENQDLNLCAAAQGDAILPQKKQAFVTELVDDIFKGAEHLGIRRAVTSRYNDVRQSFVDQLPAPWAAQAQRLASAARAAASAAHQDLSSGRRRRSPRTLGKSVSDAVGVLRGCRPQDDASAAKFDSALARLTWVARELDSDE